MNLHPWDIPSDPGRTWLERRGGWVLSACFHVAVLGLLLLNPTESIREADPRARTMRARLVEVPEPITPPAQWSSLDFAIDPPSLYPRPTDSGWRDSASPSGQPSPAEDPAEAVEPAPAGEPAAEPDAAEVASPARADPEVARMLAEHARQLGEANRQRAAQGSADLERRLDLEQADTRADQVLFNTHEPILGAIRQLDISDVDPVVAEEVLGRYGMRFSLGSGQRDTGAYGFLNSARDEGGIYMQEAGYGMYRMFSYGPRATRRMIELEREEIVRRGWDPDRVRIVRTVFGIVSTGDGYDLGVKRMRAEALPEPVPGEEAAD